MQWDNAEGLDGRTVLGAKASRQPQWDKDVSRAISMSRDAGEDEMLRVEGPLGGRYRPSMLLRTIHTQLLPGAKAARTPLLDSGLLNVYLQLMAASPEFAGRSFVADTFCTAKILEQRVGWADVPSARGMQDPMTYERLFFPVLENGNHYILIVVCPRTKEILTLDSIGPSRPRAACANILVFLKLQYMRNGGTPALAQRFFDPRNWSAPEIKGYPKQLPGGMDCGVCVCLAAEAELLGKRLTQDLLGNGDAMRAAREQMARSIVNERYMPWIE